MNFQQLEQLWISQGGDPAYAPIMAAIALAESSGDPANTTGDGGTSWGLYQIHWTVHPQFDTSQLLDPAYNTQAAIQLSGNGQNLSPWTTWQSYVAGDGGHGDQVISSLLGPYVPGFSSSGTAGSSPVGASSSSSSSSLPWYEQDIPNIWDPGYSGIDKPSNLGGIPGAIAGFTNALSAIGSTAIVAAGAIALLLIGGIWLASGNRDIRQVTYNASKTATEAALAA